MNKLAKFFYDEPKRRVVHKWEHYFDIYDKHFQKFIGKRPKILEIGVYKGGSIDMWKYYFGECTIYGIDIDPDCKQYEEPGVHIFIGDQGSSEFWDTFKETDFDIIIDDGGHTMHQQIYTFERMYDRVVNGGIYLCEDTHTSYVPHFGGGLNKQGTFIEYSKTFIDLLHAYYNSKRYTDLIGIGIDDNLLPIDFRRKTWCVSYYDSIVVLDKKLDNRLPSSVKMN